MSKRKIPPFETFRDVKLWQSYIKEKLPPFEKNFSSYLKYWYLESRDSENAYPSQGMLTTPFDNFTHVQKGMLPPEKMVKILRIRQYFLELFNHPERISVLKKVQKSEFKKIPKVKNNAMEKAIENNLALSIEDLGIAVVGSQKERVSRKKRFKNGPFVKLGRRARTLFVGSAMPDVYGSVYAISTMAQSHCLTGVPRNGPFSNIKRQKDLVKEVWKALEESEVLIGKTKKQKEFLISQWKHNVMGVLEANPEKALKRARALYKEGVKTFRIYSPEPGTGTLKTLKKLRKELGQEIEIFAGQVVDVTQAKQLEKHGADGLYIGIGGGGRCTTGVRSGSVIDWPILLWQLRGEVSIPVVIEGGASDHIATTLALGGTGIGVSRIAAGGTIESPGGMLFCIDEKGNYFKPYGGEASARTKHLDQKMLPFGIPSFVEGETRTAEMMHLEYGEPTIPFHIFNLTEDAILSLVFRATKNVSELQGLDPSPIRRKTTRGALIQNTH